MSLMLRATTSLLNYTAFGRLPEDLEAVPMPRPVYNLGVALWTVAFDFLTDLSKRHPPTGCQLLAGAHHSAVD